MDQTDTGQQASAPWQLPLRGWRDVLKRVWNEVGKDNIDLVAAGVAFYLLLSIFPGIIAAVSIWGLVADPVQVQDMLQATTETMPAQARKILEDQLSSVAGGQSTALGLGTVLGLLGALWSANKGTKALMNGLNIAYDASEERGFLALNAQGFGILLALVLTGVVATSGVLVIPVLIHALDLQGPLAWLVRILRWPILALAVMGFLAVCYRFGPSRSNPQWSWASVGAVMATVLWLVASALFSLYVGRFGNYQETYGSIAGVVILLLWFWITAFVILLGAELNAELERQTAEDTTVGPPEPEGSRGAWVADHHAGEDTGPA